MDVTVIIPWRPGCPWREANLERVMQWWEEHHPTWQIRIGEWPEKNGPWRKACAVASAGTVDSESIVVVSDADVICPDVETAVDVINDRSWSTCNWAMPYRTAYRLTEAATILVNELKWFPPLTQNRFDIAGLVNEVYPGSSGGGIVAMRGHALNDVPLDPRFAGYGHEDHSWSLALHMLKGAPYLGGGPLWHLWHPPQDRVAWGVGSEGNRALYTQYRQATTPALMRHLINDAKTQLETIQDASKTRSRSRRNNHRMR